MKTHLDWSAYDTYGAGDAYAGIPASGGNYAKAVAVCMNNQQCQRDGKGVMCPSYRVTGDPAHSTQARVKAFKAALNGELGADPFAHPTLAEAMELCVACKACKKECPSAVDMTLIKTEYLAQRNDCLGVPLRMTPRTPTESAFWVVKPWDRFRLEPALPPAADGLERLHTHLHLTYRYAEGGTEILILGLELFHLLLELKDGTQLSGVGEEAIF
ncbi:MAG: (Fe-S)-binding protein, partial [Thiobacillus sp.]|nr:(Fe-S)-binding protein [Thiobacillus sp.]